ncbi:MAG: hypothetical protein ACRDD8_06185 [Bacteroidales bacterium]
MTFEDLDFEQRPNPHVQRAYVSFNNGFGLSVIKDSRQALYFDCCVLYDGDVVDVGITNQDGYTSGYFLAEEVNELLIKVSNLEPVHHISWK